MTSQGHWDLEPVKVVGGGAEKELGIIGQEVSTNIRSLSTDDKDRLIQN